MNGTTTTDTTVAETIVAQIGRLTVCAISGGRVSYIVNDEWDETDGIVLPVSNGYSVEVVLDRGRDTYVVRRVFTRGGKRWVKGERTDVYADEVSDVAYFASSFRSHDEF